MAGGEPFTDSHIRWGDSDGKPRHPIPNNMRRKFYWVLVIVAGDLPAVALKYNPRTAAAPIVAAKGRDEAAAAIPTTAQRGRVRVVEEAKLTRSIVRETPVGSPVAAAHYQALTRLWQLCVTGRWWFQWIQRTFPEVTPVRSGRRSRTRRNPPSPRR